MVMLSTARTSYILVLMIFLVSLSAFQQVFASPITVRVDPAIAIKDQVVTLTISLNSKNQETPDTSVLRSDFQILKQTMTNSVSQEKGITFIQKNWVLLLLPLRKGKIIIPSIKIGNQRTTPIRLKVMDAMPKAEIKLSSTSKDIFVEVETDLQEAYVQGQIILTQKIYHSIPLKTATLSPPKIRDNTANMVPLAKDKPYYWNVKGKRYHVIERSYALFPKHSGTLHIEKADFVGELKTPSTLLSKLEETSHQKNVKTYTPPLQITVKPQADLFTGHQWLPAKNIILYGSWSTPLSNLQKNDPITLQLSIIADGLRAEQLPDIKLEIPKETKFYLEPPVLHNNITLTGVTGIWSQKITLLPSSTEPIVIPKFQLSWWNTLTEQQELALFKEQILHIGSDTDRSKTNSAITKTISIADNVRLEKNSNLPTPAKETSVDINKGWIILILLPLGYLAYQTYIKLFSKKIDNHKINNSNGSNDSNDNKEQQHILDSLKLACLENNPEKSQQILLQWAKTVAIKPPTLDGISTVENAYLAPEVALLSQALYRKNKASSTWNGSVLWKAIEKYPSSNNELPSIGIHSLQKMYPRDLN